jgi:hypothetical protein
MKPFKFFSRDKDTIEYRNGDINNRWFCEPVGTINWMESLTGILFYMDRNEEDENVISTKIVTVQTYRFPSFLSFMLNNVNNYIWVFDVTVVGSLEQFDINNQNDIPNNVPIIIRAHIENG